MNAGKYIFGDKYAVVYTEAELGCCTREPYIIMSTTNWHLPRALPTTEQQSCLPSASMETEPHAAIAVDPQQSLREFRVE